MPAKLRARLTFANVMSTLAVFIALSGGAYALTIPNNSVGAKQLKRNAVTGPKIKRGAVTSAKVRDRSLRSTDFAAGQLPAGPAGPQGERGAQGPAGENAPKLFAYIRDTAAGDTGTATMQYGSGVTGVTDGVSSYEVTFNRSVTGCVVQATPGRGDPQGDSPILVEDATGQATMAVPPENNVAITFTNNANATVDTSFFVTAFC